MAVIGANFGLKAPLEDVDELPDSDLRCFRNNTSPSAIATDCDCAKKEQERWENAKGQGEKNIGVYMCVLHVTYLAHLFLEERAELFLCQG